MGREETTIPTLSLAVAEVSIQAPSWLSTDTHTEQKNTNSEETSIFKCAKSPAGRV